MAFVQYCSNLRKQFENNMSPPKPILKNKLTTVSSNDKVTLILDIEPDQLIPPESRFPNSRNESGTIIPVIQRPDGTIEERTAYRFGLLININSEDTDRWLEAIRDCGFSVMLLHTLPIITTADNNDDEYVLGFNQAHYEQHHARLISSMLQSNEFMSNGAFKAFTEDLTIPVEKRPKRNIISDRAGV